MTTGKERRGHLRDVDDLDRATAERMFAGLAADDAPPGYARTAALLAAAAAPIDDPPRAGWMESVAGGPPSTPGEYLGEYAALRAYREAMTGGVPVRRRLRFQPWRTAAGRIAALASAGALALGSGVAAAATGSLPAPAPKVANVVPDDFRAPIESLIEEAVEPPTEKPVDPPATARAPEFVPVKSVGLGPDSDSADTTADPDEPRLSDATEQPPTAGADSGEAPRPGPTPTEAEDVAGGDTVRGRGKDVSARAKSDEPGRGHGARVCALASDGTCLPGHRHADPRPGHERDTGAAHSKRGGKNGNNKNTDHAVRSAPGDAHGRNGAHATRGHGQGDGSANSMRGRANSNGSANRSRGHHDSAERGADREPRGMPGRPPTAGPSWR